MKYEDENFILGVFCGMVAVVTLIIIILL